MSTTIPPPARKIPSADRLIAAALQMFSRKGMAATTREIAEEAGVNEVTLFRLFESKDQLLAAVVREVVRAESEALDQVDLEDFDLRRDLTNIAEVYSATNEQYLDFVRTMMSQRMQPGLTEQIMREVIQPLRAKFIAWLAEGQKRGLVRSDIELVPAVDAFTGMIFAASLRRSVWTPGYSRETYLETCVALFIQGVSAPMRECPRAKM